MLSAKDCSVPPRRQSGSVEGFTLIESMFTLALLGIFAAIAVPSLTPFVGNNRTQAANNELFTRLQFARGSAVAERGTVPACPGSGRWAVRRRSCSGKPPRTMEIPEGVTVSGNRNQIACAGNGSAASPVTLPTCSNNDFANGFIRKAMAACSIRRFARGQAAANGAEPMKSCAQPSGGDGGNDE